jgi:hypothetical protein
MSTNVERKMEALKQFGLYYIDSWKCHNETPCIAILNKQKYLFSKMKDMRENSSCLRVCSSERGEDIRKG